MRTIETKVYKFNELSEQAQQKAIENLWDINVTHEWWELIYDDAKRIGLQITEFDLDRGRYAKGKMQISASEMADLILKNHGEHCETYKTALRFEKERGALVAKYSDGKDLEIVANGNEYEFDNECDDLESEFLKSLLEDYSVILQKEYEYLTSPEAIKETIEANEYEFTEDGKLI